MSINLREVRRQRRLSIMALAQMVKTSPAWLTYVERYGHIPGPDLRQRIAHALGVNEIELWPGRELTGSGTIAEIGHDAELE